MSLSTALSLETLTPDALFAASERDLCELWQYYDANGNGLIEFDEFEGLVTEVVNRMAAQLPSQIPARYCLEFALPPTALQGVEARIAAKFAAVSRSNLAKALFTELDVLDTVPVKTTDEDAAAAAAAAAAADSTDADATAAPGEASSGDAPAAGHVTASNTPRAAPLSRASSVAGSSAAAASPADGDDSLPVMGARGFLEPEQLRPLHTLMEKHLLKDLYETIGNYMVQKQMSSVVINGS